MGKGDVYIFMDGNSIYSLKSKKIRIYNNIITSRIIKTKIVGDRQTSTTASGSVYITVPTTLTSGYV